MMIYRMNRGRTLRLRAWYWGRKTYRYARRRPLGRFGIAMICLGVYAWSCALLLPLWDSRAYLTASR
jgi:hypothetical protein